MILFWLGQVKDTLIVYLGTIITFAMAWISPEKLTSIRLVILILVGIATLVYTIFKIVKLRMEIKKERSEKMKKEIEKDILKDK